MQLAFATVFCAVASIQFVGCHHQFAFNDRVSSVAAAQEQDAFALFCSSGREKLVEEIKDDAAIAETFLADRRYWRSYIVPYAANVCVDDEMVSKVCRKRALSKRGHCDTLFLTVPEFVVRFHEPLAQKVLDDVTLSELTNCGGVSLAQYAVVYHESVAVKAVGLAMTRASHTAGWRDVLDVAIATHRIAATEALRNEKIWRLESNGRSLAEVALQNHYDELKTVYGLVHLSKLTKLGGDPVVANALTANKRLAEDLLTDEGQRGRFDTEGSSFAYLAVSYHPELAARIVNDKPVLRTRNKNGKTVAHVAVRFASIAEQILKDPELACERDNHGVTVLGEALRFNPVLVADVLSLKDRYVEVCSGAVFDEITGEAKRKVKESVK